MHRLAASESKFASESTAAEKHRADVVAEKIFRVAKQMPFFVTTLDAMVLVLFQSAFKEI
jgi:hypothetical protein